MNPYNPIQNIRVHTDCRLHPGISYDIIVPLLFGKADPVNRCEQEAGRSPACAVCAGEVNSRAEQIYQDLPDHLKR